MTGKGRLSTFTAIYVAPTFMIEEGYGRDNPYCTGIVELEEGVRNSGQILGVDARDTKELQIGTPLTIEFSERGEEDNKKTHLTFRIT